jgi:hypothetical protein
LEPEPRSLKLNSLLKLGVLKCEPDGTVLMLGEKGLDKGVRGEYEILVARDDVGAACCWLGEVVDVDSSLSDDVARGKGECRGGAVDVDLSLVGDVARGKAECCGGRSESAEETTEARSAISL